MEAVKISEGVYWVGAIVLCADIPSGLNGDTGTCVSCVRGDYTVAVGYLKPGLLLSDGEKKLIN